MSTTTCSEDEIDEWIFVIMGFLQKQGPINGMMKIWLAIRKAFHGRSSNSCVDVRSWNCDPDDIAETVLKTHPKHKRPRIVIVGFSYGGWTAKLLTDALAERGIDVDIVVTVDAVYRHWYRAGWWRSLIPWWTKIRFGPTVKQVIPFRQNKSIPMGHQIVADNPVETNLHTTTWLACNHVFADDQQVVHDTAIRAAIGAFDEVASKD